MSQPAAEWNHPGRTWRLDYRSEPDFSRPDQVVAPLVDGILSLSQLFRPLAIRAELAYVDVDYGYHDGYPPQAEWCLDATDDGSREIRKTRVAVPAIDRGAFDDFVRTATDQPAREGAAICPVALFVTASRARLPAGWGDTGRLAVKTEGGQTEVEIEPDPDGVWVRGPTRAVTSAPIRAYGHVEGLETQLIIAAHWSPWYDDGAEGTDSVARAIDELVARGWQKASG